MPLLKMLGKRILHVIYRLSRYMTRRRMIGWLALCHGLPRLLGMSNFTAVDFGNPRNFGGLLCLAGLAMLVTNRWRQHWPGWIAAAFTLGVYSIVTLASLNSPAFVAANTVVMLAVLGETASSPDDC